MNAHRRPKQRTARWHAPANLTAAAVVCALLLAAGAVSCAVTPDTQNGIDWYDARQWGVSGKWWQDTEGYFDRFPARARQTVPSAVWNLSK